MQACRPGAIELIITDLTHIASRAQLDTNAFQLCCTLIIEQPTSIIILHVLTTTIPTHRATVDTLLVTNLSVIHIILLNSFRDLLYRSQGTTQRLLFLIRSSQSRKTTIEHQVNQDPQFTASDFPPSCGQSAFCTTSTLSLFGQRHDRALHTLPPQRLSRRTVRKQGRRFFFLRTPKIFLFVVPLKAFEWTMSVTKPNVPGRKFFSLPSRTNVLFAGRGRSNGKRNSKWPASQLHDLESFLRATVFQTELGSAAAERGSSLAVFVGCLTCTQHGGNRKNLVLYAGTKDEGKGSMLAHDMFQSRVSLYQRRGF